MKRNTRFENWIKPEILNNKLTDYNWLVQNVDGLKLGNKTDIGAHSLVSKSIPDNVTAFGIPARVIKK